MALSNGSPDTHKHTQINNMLSLHIVRPHFNENMWYDTYDWHVFKPSIRHSFHILQGQGTSLSFSRCSIMSNKLFNKTWSQLQKKIKRQKKQKKTTLTSTSHTLLTLVKMKKNLKASELYWFILLPQYGWVKQEYPTVTCINFKKHLGARWDPSLRREVERKTQAELWKREVKRDNERER